MCGIIGYVGNDKHALKKTINCLEKLEYRGYDSSGIAFINNNSVNIIKEKGRIDNLKKLIDFETKTTIAIAHTRWATHGDANSNNAHPHKVGKITLVHNGIIENYLDLKKDLEKENYTFKSDTDSEIICAVIDSIYNKKKNKIKTLNKLKDILRGSYALAIIFDDDLENIYAIKKDSPLILGIGNNDYFIASDVPAILNYTNKYIVLEDNEFAALGKNYKIYKNLKETNKKIQTFNYENWKQDKSYFEHYMLKEIHEQPNIIYKLFKEHIDTNFDLLPDLSKYEQIDIIGCGSAYHTSLVAKHLFEEYADTEVNCHIASEYRYKNNFYKKNSIAIFISQSGETADTLACLRKVKKDNIDSLAIINIEGSSIAREADQVIYIKAGPEIAVATTKAYTAQITILSLLAIKTAINKNIAINLKELQEEVQNIPIIMNKLINNDTYINIANKIFKHNKIFFIGRLIDYALSLEGALKLKEISYINTLAYPAGELKHGTISLIEDNIPVISIITDKKICKKTISNIKEVSSRGANIIIITNQDGVDIYSNNLIKIPNVNPFLQPIITILPLQLLAYNVAKLKGCDIDKPRNLAKSVTVE